MNRKSFLAGVLVLLCLCSGNVFATDKYEAKKDSVRKYEEEQYKMDFTMGEYYPISVEPLLCSDYIEGSPSAFWLYIGPTKFTGSVHLSIQTHGKLEYLGESEFDIELKKSAPWENTVNILIPPNDTSGLTITATGIGIKAYGRRHYYFVTTGDTLEIFYGYPNIEAIRNAERSKPPRIRTNEEMKDKKPYTPPVIGPVPDTVVRRSEVWSVTPQQRKELLERKALTDCMVQYLVVDKIIWVRQYGDMMFHQWDQTSDLIPPLSRRLQHRLDSLGVLNLN